MSFRIPIPVLVLLGAFLCVGVGIGVASKIDHGSTASTPAPKEVASERDPSAEFRSQIDALCEKHLGWAIENAGLWGASTVRSFDGSGARSPLLRLTRSRFRLPTMSIRRC